MDREKLNFELTELIKSVIPDIDEVDMNASITDEYGVNSISIIRLIVAAENKFGVSFSDYELDLSSYDTFGDLAAAVSEKLELED